MKKSKSTSAITKMTAAIIIVIVVIALAAGAYYALYMLPGSQPSPQGWGRCC